MTLNQEFNKLATRCNDQIANIRAFSYFKQQTSVLVANNSVSITDKNLLLQPNLPLQPPKDKIERCLFQLSEEIFFYVSSDYNHLVSSLTLSLSPRSLSIVSCQFASDNKHNIISKENRNIKLMNGRERETLKRWVTKGRRRRRSADNDDMIYMLRRWCCAVIFIKRGSSPLAPEQMG